MRFANGTSTTNTTTTAASARSRRERSSTRCDRNDCSWPVGSPGSAVIGVGALVSVVRRARRGFGRRRRHRGAGTGAIELAADLRGFAPDLAGEVERLRGIAQRLLHFLGRELAFDLG